jgi:hypothetical protein
VSIGLHFMTGFIPNFLRAWVTAHIISVWISSLRHLQKQRGMLRNRLCDYHLNNTA